MARDPLAPDPNPAGATLAILLAADAAPGLFELTEAEPTAALHFAGRRRVADLAVAEVLDAGLGALMVATRPRPDTLGRHLAARWGDRLSLAPPGPRGDGAALALRAAEARAWDRVLLLPADQVGPLDLPALLAAHRAGGSLTLGPPAGDAPGPCLIDLAWLRDAWAQGLRELPALIRAAGASPLAGPPRRRLDSLDAYREAQLDFLRSGACLPGEDGARREPGDSLTLAFEAGGLALSAPRFGARRAGRWTLLDDSVVLPGARVAPGARLTRTLVAPGAVVPAGLVAGEDPDEDARWFRVSGATTLVTTAMLARRAADRMRAHAGAALPLRPAALAPSGQD